MNKRTDVIFLFVICFPLPSPPPRLAFFIQHSVTSQRLMACVLLIGFVLAAGASSLCSTPEQLHASLFVITMLTVSTLVFGLRRHFEVTTVVSSRWDPAAINERSRLMMRTTLSNQRQALFSDVLELVSM